VSRRGKGLGTGGFGKLGGAIACRERLGEQLLATFSTRDEELHHLLAGLTPQDWDKPCTFWRFMGNLPVRAFLPLTMQELAIHGWDIRSRLEATALLSAESLPVLMVWIPARFGVARLCRLSP